MPLSFAHSTSETILGLDRAKTVFLFPLGPLEDHGPHLPLGMDLLAAEGFCHSIGKQIETDFPGWTSVVMPTAPLGVDSNTTFLSVTVRPHVLRDWLVDCARSLARTGFKTFVCVSGHLGPKQLTTIEEAGKLLGSPLRFYAPGPKATLVSASSALVASKEVWRSPLIPFPHEHGGSEDTSIALAILPELVDAGHRSAVDSPMPKTLMAWWAMRKSKKARGYYGSPSQATSERGHKIIQAQTKAILERFSPILNGERPKSRFRSWYSVMPPNWSFFKAWILALMIFLLMLVWVHFLTSSPLR